MTVRLQTRAAFGQTLNPRPLNVIVNLNVEILECVFCGLSVSSSQPAGGPGLRRTSSAAAAAQAAAAEFARFHAGFQFSDAQRIFEMAFGSTPFAR